MADSAYKRFDVDRSGDNDDSETLSSSAAATAAVALPPSDIDPYHVTHIYDIICESGDPSSMTMVAPYHVSRRLEKGPDVAPSSVRPSRTLPDVAYGIPPPLPPPRRPTPEQQLRDVFMRQSNALVQENYFGGAVSPAEAARLVHASVHKGAFILRQCDDGFPSYLVLTAKTCDGSVQHIPINYVKNFFHLGGAVVDKTRKFRVKTTTVGELMWLMQVVTSTGKMYFHCPDDEAKSYKIRKLIPYNEIKPDVALAGADAVRAALAAIFRRRRPFFRTARGAAEYSSLDNAAAPPS